MNIDDFPSIHLTFEYKSSPIDQAAVNKMKSHKSDVFRQPFDTQIERLKTQVWWGRPPEVLLIRSKTASHAFSNFAGESIRLMFGAQRRASQVRCNKETASCQLIQVAFPGVTFVFAVD